MTFGKVICGKLDAFRLVPPSLISSLDVVAVHRKGIYTPLPRFLLVSIREDSRPTTILYLQRSLGPWTVLVRRHSRDSVAFQPRAGFGNRM